MSTLFLLCKRSLSSGQKFSWKSLKVATNQQIKDLKSLLSNHRSRDTADNLLLEGHRMIIDALKYQLEPQCIYISQNGIDSPLGMRLQQALCDLNWQTKLTSLNHDQLSKLSSVETSQGVLGIFRKPIITNTEVQTQLSHSSSPLILVCDRIRDPGNLGSIIRSGYGFGVDLLVNVETCDPWSPKVLRSSMAYGLRYPILTAQWTDIPSLFTSLSEILSNQRQFQVLITDCDSNERNLQNYFHVDFTKPTVLIIGSEATGVSPEARQSSTWASSRHSSVHIPMTRSDSESLNAAAACAVVLGEIQRQRSLECTTQSLKS